MVEIMLDKLLNVSVRIAAVFSSDSIQLGLQIGIEMYFHSVRALQQTTLLESNKLPARATWRPAC
jgi:hypothetical protein